MHENGQIRGSIDETASLQQCGEQPVAEEAKHDFNRSLEYDSLMVPTESEVLFFAKAPERDILLINRATIITVSHELYKLPWAPVIRMIMTLHDQSRDPLNYEHIINPGNPGQIKTYERLIGQDSFCLLFYDEGLNHRLSMRVQFDSTNALVVLEGANKHLATIPPGRFNFRRARREVLRRTQF